ncbi:hypothetical protein JM79_0219 [Gramella sp. Hel_I_59]|uniref:hypothetical protein n=1 Tax=Gramella sp. Hel_I_59 TaxID=1249978 RepID=UPI001154147B|nr:hypothetical protein [Gramella sp. Hel_I_59]TQI69344.1 hypothetical protein JM79_0219 [Gramella sp. Hel_I_59]
MEKLIGTLGNGFYQLDRFRENYLSLWLQTSEKRFIIFIVLSLVPIALITAVFADFSFLLAGTSFKIFLFFIYLILAFSLLVITAGFYRGKSIKKLKSNGFHFKKLNLTKIDYTGLQINEDEISDFQRLILGRKVSKKINFKLNALSKKSASYRDLFTMFHIISIKGINSFDKEKKDLFFQMLQESLVMNENPVNPATLESSFSTWRNEIESDKSKKSILRLKELIGTE